MKKTFLAVLSIMILFTLAGCAKQVENNNTNENTQKTSSHKKLTAKEAKKIMDEQSDVIILDVRTDEEFAEAHIENAILLPDYDLDEKAEAVLPDKNKQILVYCRSGRRSAAAAETLTELGYTNVADFGGIIDWPYETQ